MTRLRYVGAFAHTLTAGAFRVPVVEGTEFDVSDFAALAIIKRGTPVEIVSTTADAVGGASGAANEIDLDDVGLGSDEDAEPAVGDEPVLPTEAPSEEDAEPADSAADETPKRRRRKG